MCHDAWIFAAGLPGARASQNQMPYLLAPWGSAGLLASAPYDVNHGWRRRIILFLAMKPTIPDTGTVIRLDGEKAVIRMKHEGSCRKCGAAAIGLCKGGLMRELTVINSKRARVGDTVKIGLLQGVQYRGFFLAYVIPAAALIFGIVGGHFLGVYTGIPAMDITAGFASMIAVLLFSLKRLKRLDSTSSIEIVHVHSDPWKPSFRSDEESISDHYLSCF
jgi:positive regulator of sigma E activity